MTHLDFNGSPGKITLSPKMKRMPAVDKPFKRTFEISFQEKMQVSKIALYK
jgi:hypothetical protein